MLTSGAQEAPQLPTKNKPVRFCSCRKPNIVQRKMNSYGKRVNKCSRCWVSLKTFLLWKLQRPYLILYLNRYNRKWNYDPFPKYPKEQTYSFMICTVQNGKHVSSSLKGDGRDRCLKQTIELSLLWPQERRMDNSSSISKTTKQWEAGRKDRRGRAG